MAKSMEVRPDWTLRASASQAECELAGFKFHDPGVYSTLTDTIVVAAVDADDPWKDCGRDALYEFHVWNVPHSRTLLAWIGAAPRRGQEG